MAEVPLNRVELTGVSRIRAELSLVIVVPMFCFDNNNFEQMSDSNKSDWKRWSSCLGDASLADLCRGLVAMS